uniref:Uncharacterized protein n=1 Tax=Rhizophora mucronata TaxID=61149 RepID=A0A2P2PYJ2_RHIMU
MILLGLGLKFVCSLFSCFIFSPKVISILCEKLYVV